MTRRVLFCWEIGEGSGHVSPYLGLLDALQRSGWEVALALKNTSVLGGEERARFSTVFQAPICVNEFTGIAAVPANFTETCLGFGYAHFDTLSGLARGWRSLFAAWHPDLVLSNFAPVSLLAARIDGIPRIRIGTGYENSPPGPRLPLLMPWTQEIDARLERAEDLALRTANAVLRENARPLAQSVSEIVSEVPTLLATIPELDRFANRDVRSTTFLGPLPAMGKPAFVPEGEAEIFAYLRLELRGSTAALESLARGKRKSWAYVPDASDAVCASLGGASLAVGRSAFDLSATLPRVRTVMSYASHGMVLSTLLAGKPTVLVPGNGEQSYTAHRVAELGLGIVVGPQAKASQFTAALERCLEDSGQGARARGFAESHQEWTTDRALSRAIDACNRVVAEPRGLKLVGGQP